MLFSEFGDISPIHEVVGFFRFRMYAQEREICGNG